MIIEKPIMDLEEGDVLVVSSPGVRLITAQFLYAVIANADELFLVTQELDHPIWVEWNNYFPVWLGAEEATWCPGPIPV